MIREKLKQEQEQDFETMKYKLALKFGNNSSTSNLGYYKKKQKAKEGLNQ